MQDRSLFYLLSLILFLLPSGNVTTTSVRGLEPGTEYVFSIAAIAEDIHYANAPTDLYGRREPVDEALVGEFSTYTNITATLAFDFDFSFFSANSTLNHTGVYPLILLCVKCRWHDTIFR